MNTCFNPTARVALFAAMLPALAFGLDYNDLASWRDSTGEWTNGHTISIHPDDAGKLQWTEGHGAIVNGPTGRTVNIFTTDEYGDLKVELEVMVPKGSNSGIYLQGRYEIQVLDSWGVKKPESSDIGGIYQRWIDNKGVDGIAPKVNAATEPGTWQQFTIIFRAPRFDEKGKKIAPATFESVVLNGQTLHENAICKGPTRSSAWNDEAPWGPLMIQGDHGPVAYRNIVLTPLDGGKPRADLDDSAYVNILRYSVGQTREAITTIERQLRGASQADREKIEARLITILRDGNGSLDGKNAVLELLRICGSYHCVPAVAPYLTRPSHSHAARLAMENLNAKSADTALLTALEKAPQDLAPGLISTLGRRQVGAAVPAIAPFVEDRDPEVASVAIEALGRIGNLASINALKTAKLSEVTEPKRLTALLTAAFTLANRDSSGAATGIFHDLSSPRNPPSIRIAAYRGLAQAGREQAVPLVLALMQDFDDPLQRMATQLVAETPGVDATRAFASVLPDLPADTAVGLLAALGTRGDPAALPSVTQAARKNDSEAVRLAAINALGKLGNGGTVRDLADIADEGGDLAKAAEASLIQLKGHGVDFTISKYLRDATPGTAEVLVRAIAARNYSDATLQLITLADAPSPTLRREALRALIQIAQPIHITPLINAINANRDEDVQTGLERALANAASRTTDDAARVQALQAGLAGAKIHTQGAILRTLGKFGGPGALAIVELGLKSSNDDIYEAAVRALLDWPDDSPAPLLLELAQNARQDNLKTLALRAYIQSASKSSLPGPEKAVMLQRAMEIAPSVLEKRAILAAAAQTPSPQTIILAKSCLNDPALEADAKAALSKIEEAMKDMLIIYDEVLLHAKDAEIHGSGAQYEAADNRQCIGSWSNAAAWVSWELVFRETGIYEVAVSQSMAGHAGATYTVTIAGQNLTSTIQETGDWARFREFSLGKLKIDQPGVYTVSFKPTSKPKGFVANLRGVILRKLR